MSIQSVLPFATLGSPAHSEEKGTGAKREREVESIDTVVEQKKLKTATSKEENDEVQPISSETIAILDINDDNETTSLEQEEKAISKQKVPQENFAKVSSVLEKPNEATAHKREKTVRDQKLKALREQEKEEKRLKKEEEKQRREAKKKQIEEEKVAKRLKIEEERVQKRLQLERQKEEKREKLEAEKEAKRIKLEKEKEEKRLKLEKEKAEKEAAEKRKLEDEERKNKTQMRIGSFFKLKAEAATPSISKAGTSEESSYSTSFLAFFIKENAEVFQKLSLSADDIALNNAKFESSLQGVPSDATRFFETNPCSFTTHEKKTTVSEIAHALNNNQSEQEILALVERVPKKYLSFYENARPPYSGTISRTIESVRAAYNIDLSKNPFLKIPDATIDYSYDSDLEWNPEEDDEGEGEEIDDEEMSACEASDDEEDDDFLEKDMQLKKRALIGPLTPVIKIYTNSAEETDDDEFFNSMRLESLRWEYPIDPFENYWAKPEEDKQPKAEKKEPAIITVSSLNSSVSSAIVASSPLKVNTNTVNVLTGHKKPKQVITNEVELLKILQYVASNSDLSISTLVELTRKSLDNKYPNAVVRATIDKYFNKKNKKTYELNDSNTIKSLTSIVEGIKSSDI